MFAMDYGLVAVVGTRQRRRRTTSTTGDWGISSIRLAGWMAGAMVLVASVAAVGVEATETSEMSIEAAFQGRCGRGSPCMQLCYELHDGMYECDCTEGYELNKNGYSCEVINSTYSYPNDDLDKMPSDTEDVLYQRDASFIAKLDGPPSSQSGAGDTDESNTNSGDTEDDGGVSSDDDDSDDDVSDEGIPKSSSAISNDIDDHERADMSFAAAHHRSAPKDQHSMLKDKPKFTVRTVPSVATSSKSTPAQTTGTLASTESSTTTLYSGAGDASITNNYYPAFKEDMSVYDDVNNNRLNLRSPSEMYQMGRVRQQDETAVMGVPPSASLMMTSQSTTTTTTTTTTVPDTTTVSSAGPDSTSHSYIQIDVFDNGEAERLFVEAERQQSRGQHTTASTPPETISSRPEDGGGSTASTIEQHISTTREPCELDCGTEGLCDSTNGIVRCLCPFGRAGAKCEETAPQLNTPRFSKNSWIAFPALRGAYKHVQLNIEFRPETFNGILLLTGERDDLTGDFMAVFIHEGFIEFWFDCGSGTGKVRSEETVQLNEWNSITVYRHRWDAWILLNDGKRVQGRSKGLFSRITFREPVFLGGTGNITGLARTLPVFVGLVGCIRKFIANEHEYEFGALPHGDVMQGFDVLECTQDRCGRYPCRHGGKCLPSDQGAICLCPLGFGGDLCEMRLDLQVPSFNGSSYLRFAPLGDSSLIWFELRMVIKPQSLNGLLLYSGHQEYGDYISLCLNEGYVEFAFDLGSGTAVVRSELPLALGRWHTIKVSRTARLAVLKINQLPEVMTISPNGFWHLSLPHSVFLGGVQNQQRLPAAMRERGSFVGCIQKVDINDHPISIIAEALGGTNVDNCPHACVDRPCGALATCVPNLDNYECVCNPANAQCNQAEEVPSIQISVAQHRREMEIKRNITHILRSSSSTPKPSTTIKPSATTTSEQSSNLGDSDLLRTHVIKTASEIIVASSSDSVTIVDHLRATKKGAADKNIPPPIEERPQSDGPVADSEELYADYIYEENQYSDENVEKEITATTTTTTTTTTTRPPPTTRTTTLPPIITDVNEDLDTAEKYPNQLVGRDLTTSTTYTDSVTRVYGRYMSVDNDKLIQMDQHLRQKFHKFPTQQHSSSKPRKTKKVHPPPPQHVMESASADAIEQQQDLLTTKELLDDMERIMKNGNDIRAGKRRSKGFRRSRGACFTGADSYFHYNDAETMRQVISYQIDLNLRFKTHSVNGLILWTGRHSALEEDDYLSLGIENGFLHLRYNLGSGEVNIHYNATRVSDGLWHRIRAFRNHQEGSLEVDGGRSVVQRSPGKLRQLNTDTGLYVGGMPDVQFYTRRRYSSGIVGCISEIVLAGELRLSLDPETLGTAHNVEPGNF